MRFEQRKSFDLSQDETTDRTFTRTNAHSAARDCSNGAKLEPGSGTFLAFSSIARIFNGLAIDLRYGRQSAIGGASVSCCAVPGPGPRRAISTGQIPRAEASWYGCCAIRKAHGGCRFKACRRCDCTRQTKARAFDRDQGCCSCCGRSCCRNGDRVIPGESQPAVASGFWSAEPS